MYRTRKTLCIGLVRWQIDGCDQESLHPSNDPAILVNQEVVTGDATLTGVTMVRSWEAGTDMAILKGVVSVRGRQGTGTARV